MKVLFITRKYPPQVGGMERYSFDLINNFHDEKEIIALKKSQKHLIWFIPYALIKSMFLVGRADIIYLCDSLLGPLGLVLKILFKKPVLATAHGLDIIYDNWIYQNVNVRSLKYLDKVIAVSKSTRDSCINSGIESNKCVFIPNGIVIKNDDKQYNRSDLEKFLKFKINNKKILLSLGRVTKRKGIDWFIENVMGLLDDDAIYLVAGLGSQEKELREKIIKNGLINQVITLGKVTDNEKAMLLQTADIFIMPNVKIKNDKEGFGLTMLEASLAGLPVVASNIEGIKDAIINNKNGYLVEASDKHQFLEKINDLLNDKKATEIGKRFSDYTRENYDWKKIILRYEEEFKNILKDRN